MKHCISIDVETTGVDENKHAIVDFGVCNFVNKNELSFEFTMPSEVVYDSYALKVNGNTEEGLRGRVSEPDGQYCSLLYGMLALEKYIIGNDCKVLIGKNPAFDYRFLNHAFKACGIINPLSYRVINWGDMALPLMLKEGLEVPAFGFSSTEICDFLDLEPEPKPHIGITGARYNKMCVDLIMERYEDYSINL